MPSWDPRQYLKFSGERTRPAQDLAAAIAIGAPETVLDVGCGPANSTAVLAARWPDARLIGLDSSVDMLDAARKKLPGVSFVQRDMREDLSDLGIFDVVFSNAALQWLPAEAEAVLHLWERVKPGGAFAVQVPACAPLITGEGRLETGDAHRLFYDTAEEIEFACYTAGVTRFLDFDGNRIYALLAPEAEKMNLWETRYCHVLDGYDGLIEWYRGTGMRPYLEALPDETLQARFVARFRERVAVEFPLMPDGKLLMWFRRLFFIAYK